MSKTVQPMNTFFVANVKPGALANIKLSGGPNEPFFYSLGANSTVPFIQLEGGGGTQKEFSWGETIEVPAGQQLQVKSASYMAGDVQIQSGRDIANKPERITVPVELPESVDGFYVPGDVIIPLYACDTRMARRAFLALAWQTGETVARVRIKGFNQQHSYPAAVRTSTQLLPPTGKKYVNDNILANLTSYGFIPLGFRAEFTNPDFPHALLDYATVEVHVDDGAIESPAQFFYVLEYA